MHHVIVSVVYLFSACQKRIRNDSKNDFRKLGSTLKHYLKKSHTF